MTKLQQVLNKFCDNWESLPYTVYPEPDRKVHYRNLSQKMVNWLYAVDYDEQIKKGQWHGVIGNLAVSIAITKRNTGQLKVYKL